MAKKVMDYIKLHIEAGKANPAPPVGPALDNVVLTSWNSLKHLMKKQKIKWDLKFL